MGAFALTFKSATILACFCFAGSLLSAQVIPQTPVFTPIEPGRSHNLPPSQGPFPPQESVRQKVARLLPPQPKPGDPNARRTLPHDPRLEAEHKRLRLLNERSLGNQRNFDKQLAEVSTDIMRLGPKMDKISDAQYIALLTRHEAALAKLADMLEGRAPLSVKRAAFLVEQAWLGDLNWNRFDAELRRRADLVRSRLPASSTNEDRHAALLAFFRDTTWTTGANGQPTVAQLPLRFDFEDIWGDKDWSRMFVTRLLRTGGGQCRSLSLLYLLLAQEVGAEAGLAFAPGHAFIRRRDAAGEWRNLELTNGTYLNDAAYLQTGYVKAEAVRNGVWLRAQTDTQTVAWLAAELAKGWYYHVDAIDARGFIQRCSALSETHGRETIDGLIVRSNVLTARFLWEMDEARWPDLKTSGEKEHVKAKRWLREARDCYRRIDGAGYESIPPEVYERWLRSLS